MKKYFSVINQLLVKRIYMLLGASIIIALLDINVAFLAVNSVERFMLGYVFSHIGFSIILVAGFSVCTILNCLGRNNVIAPGLVSDKEAYICKAIANAITFIVFWMLQSVFIILIARVLINLPDCSENSIGLFVDFERNSYMHVVLPVGDISIVIRNIVFAMSLGLNLTLIEYHIETKSIPMLIILTALIMFMEYLLGYGNYVRNYIFSAIEIILAVICYIKITMILDKKNKEVKA